MRSHIFLSAVIPLVRGVLLLHFFIGIYSLKSSQAKTQHPITKKRLEQIAEMDSCLPEDQVERKKFLENARNPSQSRVTPQNKIISTAQQNPNNMVTARTFLEEEQKISAVLRSQTVPEINCDISIPDEGELLQTPKDFIQLEQTNVDMNISAMGHYLIAFPTDRVTVYLYKWHALIHKSNGDCLKFTVPSKSPIAHFSFLLNDTYLQFDFDDGTSMRYFLIDSQKEALRKQEEAENKTFTQEIDSLKQLSPEELLKRSQKLFWEILQGNNFVLESKDAYPSSGKVMTSCERFTPLTAWLVKDDPNILPPQGYKLKAEPCGIRLLRHHSSKAIILHIPYVGILYKINNLDIMKWKLLIGNPMVICLYTADGACHVVIAQTDTLIPVTSNVSAVIRGPRDYLIICKNGTWFILKLSEPNPLQTPSPTSSTSTSEPNSPSASRTPSFPSSPNNSNAPSASTSSATTSCAPSTQSSYLRDAKPLCLSDIFSDNRISQNMA